MEQTHTNGDAAAHAAGRLTARPADTHDERTMRPGIFPLGLARGRDGLVYVPRSATRRGKAPLLVLLHGAGGHASGMIEWFTRVADRRGVILVAPDSRGSSWDVIEEDLGPDVAFLDRALVRVFERYSVDPKHIAISGFSDGASYALTIGLANGVLFRHVLAFSPGFAAPPELSGTPRVFVSHGTEDRVLPIAKCSRTLVPRLRRAGLPIEYVEFEGPHTIPARLMDEAFAWWLGERATASKEAR